MYGDSICKSKLFSVRILINRHFIIIKTHDKLHNLHIDAFNDTYVTIVHSHASFNTEAHGLSPFLLIVVLHLHDFVTLTEDKLTAPKFLLFLAGRIQCVLQISVEIVYACGPALHRTKHLDFLRAYVEIIRKTLCDKVNGCPCNLLCASLFFKEEVTASVVHCGHFAVVDFVGVGYDVAVFTLTINLGEITDGETSTAYEVTKHVACAH